LRAIGQAQQIEMLNYSQDKLKKHDVSLYRNKYETEAEKKRLAQMEADKKLPKEQRVHNSHNQQIDKQKKELKHFKNLNKKEQDKHDIYRKTSNNFESDLIEKRNESKNLDEEISGKKGILNKVKEEFSKFKDELKDFKNKLLGNKPEKQVINQAQKTVTQGNNVISAIPETKETVDAALQNVAPEATGALCSECGINPSMVRSLCMGCYSQSDEYENDTAEAKQAKLKDKLAENKVGQSINYKPTPKGPK
jgi:chromosome segregation ATPase